jgi:hypothetical protein
LEKYDKILLFQVITSLGPAKPQRSVNNNNNNSGPSEIEHCHLLAGSSTTTLSPPPHKLCLETSFTSRQNNVTDQPNDSSHLPWEFVSLVEPASEKRNDLIYDEWFGLAPLATPESFSEVSSISSRASMIGKKLKCEYTEQINPYTNSVVGTKDTHCVRFNESLNASTEISPQPSLRSLKKPMCVEFNRGNIFSRIFKKGRNKNKFSTCEIPIEIQPEPEPKPELQTLVEIPVNIDSGTSTESSPLLSSLHLLTDHRFTEILGQPITKDNDTDNDSISNSSFQSINSLQDLQPTISSTDSVTVNAEIHRSPGEFSELRSRSSLGGESLLEDIERSLKICLSRTGSSAKLTTLSRTASSTKLTEFEIDISDDNARNECASVEKSSIEGGGSKYMYPLLLVGHGESSV